VILKLSLSFPLYFHFDSLTLWANYVLFYKMINSTEADTQIFYKYGLSYFKIFSSFLEAKYSSLQGLGVIYPTEG
jgi:hypothetical protein